jgi:long-chain fatty acid transport protein
VTRTRFVAAGLAVACAPLFVEGRAAASGFATARFGGEHGNVTETNPTALYYNPAAIAFSDQAHLYLDWQLAMRSLTWDHPNPAPSEPTDPPANIGNTGRAALFNLFGAPALGVTARLGDFAGGLGVFIPFGGKEHFDKTSLNDPDYPLANGGPQRWQVTDAELSSVYITAGLAYRLGPIAIGAAGNLIDSRVKLTKAQNLAGNQVPNSLAEGRATIDVSGLNASFGAGAMLELIPHALWLAGSYQAQPGLGVQSLQGTMGAISYPPGQPPQGAPAQNVTFTQALPDIWRAGFRFRPGPGFELRAFGDYTRWSAMKAQCVVLQGHTCQVYPDGSDATGSGAVLANFRRDWKDTYGGRVGASVWVSPSLEVFAGGGYETGAVPDSTLENSVADADNVAGALGARIALTDTIFLAGSYTHIYFFTRDNTGLSTRADASGPTQQPDGGGVYRQWVGVFDANMDVQF